MGLRGGSLVSAACLLGLVARAFAQEAAAPDIRSEASVRQWAADARIQDVTTNPTAAWNLIAAVDEGVLSYSVLGASEDRKLARVAIRMERFRPRDGFRSDATVYVLDCPGSRLRKVQDASFSEHNFGGRRAERPVSGDWAPLATNGLVGALKPEVCGGAPVDVTSEREIRQWMNANSIRDRNVAGQVEWTLLGGVPDGILFTSRGDFTVESRRVDVALRRDFWRPMAHPQLGSMRSELLEYEVNCSSRQMRQIAATQYADWNLLGRAHGSRNIEAWFPIEQHPVLGKSLDTTCQDFRVQREFKLRPPAQYINP